MTESPPSPKPQPEDIAAQLERTAADLRTLGEQLGAVQPGGSAPMTRRRATVMFTVTVAVALLVAWFIWTHWHSVLAAAAPLLWIFGHGWRWRRRVSQDERTDS